MLRRIPLVLTKHVTLERVSYSPLPLRLSHRPEAAVKRSLPRLPFCRAGAATAVLCYVNSFPPHRFLPARSASAKKIALAVIVYYNDPVAFWTDDGRQQTRTAASGRSGGMKGPWRITDNTKACSPPREKSWRDGTRGNWPPRPGSCCKGSSIFCGRILRMKDKRFDDGGNKPPLCFPVSASLQCCLYLLCWI